MTGNVPKTLTIEEKLAVEVRRRNARMFDFRRIRVFGDLSGRRIGHASDQTP